MSGDRFETVNLVTAGYPCQGESLMGKRKGAEDERWLWEPTLRIIRDSGADWFIGENTIGHISMGLDTVLSDLESIGYTSRAFTIAACAINAPHIRERVFVVAHSNSYNMEGRDIKIEGIRFPESGRIEALVDVSHRGVVPKREFCGKNDGIPSRVDRLKGLGNAIVPQVVVPIMQTIKGCY